MLLPPVVSGLREASLLSREIVNLPGSFLFRSVNRRMWSWALEASCCPRSLGEHPSSFLNRVLPDEAKLRAHSLEC